MPNVACPSCQTRLQIAATARRPSLSCPRCLAGFDNPLLVAPAPEAAPPASHVRCAWCAEDVPERSVFCPCCGESIGSRPPGRAPLPPVEADVVRDTRRTGAGLILLALLGAIGLVPIVVAVVGSASDSDAASGVAILCLPAFLGTVILGIVLSFRQGDPDSRKIGRAIVGTFAVGGVLVLVTIGLLLAAFVYFLVICFSSMGGSHP